ncbi:monovalent cation:H+ antiporter, CPA1 (nhx1) [Dipsacomyces acuminosporus]|nr:monovalent cation:H+ antiporter, CPA1 (nhx1) [Dipsacomyces acuminosporus]
MLSAANTPRAQKTTPLPGPRQQSLAPRRRGLLLVIAPAFVCFLRCISATATTGLAGLQSAPTIASIDYLADMKRKNEADSDHRNIMTPEFREFCITTREHVICCSAFLAFFTWAYITVRRASTHRQHVETAPAGTNEQKRQSYRSRGGRRIHARYLTTPYSTAFRARQITLIVAAVGLAAAGMLVSLLAVTIALSNTMDHGDPKAATNWRTWLLPPSLLIPGQELAETFRAGTSASAGWIGPQGAHDFPPVLRRLWLYQSSISIFCVVFLLPVGILFESTSLRATTVRRLTTALARWLAACAGVLVFWEVSCSKIKSLSGLGLYRPLSPSAATIRYSIYYAMCVFGALPTVLLIIPRGTWAMLGWLRCCVGQKSKIARMAIARRKKLLSEQARIQKRLRSTIKSWKWEQVQDTDDSIEFADSCSGADEQAPDNQHRKPNKGPPAGLPPVHPSLSVRSSVPRFRPLRQRISNLSTRSSSIPRDMAGEQADGQLDDSTSSLHRSSAHIHTSSSTSSLVQYHSDDREFSDDGLNGLYMVRGERNIHKKRRLEREREQQMQRLSRQINRYHAQLLFIRQDLAKIEKSGVILDTLAGGDSVSNDVPSPSTGKSMLALVTRNAPSLILSAAVGLCWLLIVVQVVHGALSAIFVGEPDLTQSFTYFIPALSASSHELVRPAASLSKGPVVPDHHGLPLARPIDWSQLSVPWLITLCQTLSGLLLFAVVMFGLLSFGTTFEDSVHPLRFIAASYSVYLLRARQWDWLPHVLLSQDVLEAIRPLTSHPALSTNDLPTKLAGSTACIYFSSSNDLTSYYRELQHSSSLSPSAPNTLLPSGIMPDIIFQSRTWSQRVFLLWSRSPTSASVSGKQLLVYIWIVCALATTWPSVLRTTDLISERAYLLPIASLVQPLWTPYEIDEELIVHPIHTLKPQQQEPENVPLSADVEHEAGMATATAAPGIASNNASSTHLNGAIQNTHAPISSIAAAAATTTTSSTATYISSWQQDSMLSTTDQPSSAPSTNVTAPLPRTISRRALLQSLAADTPQRILVKWLLHLGKAHSPRTAAVLGYFIWWYFPDQIVPLSSTVVNLQLGYIPQAADGSSPPLVVYTDVLQYSEWYGMLRRLSLNTIWLPQADDGTPLMIRQAPSHSEPSMADRSANGQIARAESSAWHYAAGFVSTTSSLMLAGTRALASYAAVLLRAIVQQLLAVASLCVGVCLEYAEPYVQSTFLGTILSSVFYAASLLAYASVYTAQAVWESALGPLCCQTRFIARGFISCMSHIASIVASADIGSYGSSMSTDTTKALGRTADITSMVPVLFMPEYWSAAAALSGPASQRLRLELWPHLLNSDHFRSAGDSSRTFKSASSGDTFATTAISNAATASANGPGTCSTLAKLDALLQPSTTLTSLVPPKDQRPSPADAVHSEVLDSKQHPHLGGAKHDSARPLMETATTSTSLGTGVASLTSTSLATMLTTAVSLTTSTVLSSTTTASRGPGDPEEPLPEEEEKVSSQALLILVSLLIAALLTSYYLQRWRIRTIHETVLSIFAGMAVGLVLRFSTGSYIKRIVTFDHTVFFNMLLPPIILNCGYNLQKTSVARNIPSVLSFAFIGTAVSAIVIGSLVQIYSFTGIESIKFSFLDSLSLGTILSATDPVTILAVFEQLRVDPKLFSIIFGETVLNDAVAIVMFATLGSLRAAGQDFTLAAVPGMLGSFVFVFTMSLLVGVVMGIFMSLICKHTRLYEYPSIEASLVLLLAYQSYLFSNAIELSGIVSLLFCAATMRQYAYQSLSIKSKRATRYLFHLLSGLAENFVFIYLGISLFTASDVLFRPVFIVYVMISTCISRYSAIFPLSRILNAIFKYRHPSAPSSAQPVTHEEQTMLFWAGLRGAVAVALSSEVSGKNGPLLRTTVLCVVVLSVTIFGGTTPQVVQRLGIRTGVEQPDSSDEEDLEDYYDDNDSESHCENEDSARGVIDLSSGNARATKPGSSDADGGNSQAIDMQDIESTAAAAAAAAAAAPVPNSNDQAPEESIQMVSLPRRFNSISSSWLETGESWYARIKNSYRSVDRSLIYDLDRHYIQPLLTRDVSRDATTAGSARHPATGRRRRRRRGSSHHNAGSTRTGPVQPGSQPAAIRHVYSNSDFHEVDGRDANSSWPSYYPAENDDSNWGSSGSDVYDYNAQRQARNQQPLLKKSR